jgi:hypothetical protein
VRSEYPLPCVQNFRWSTSVDSDPTHPWKPTAFQGGWGPESGSGSRCGEFGKSGWTVRAQTEGEWVPMRPTGALSFQLDWKDLHTAGRPSPPPFLTHGVPFTLCTEFPLVHNGGLGPNSPLEVESVPRGDGGPSPEAEAVAVNSVNQGGRYMPWECRRRYPTRWPWARPSGRTRQAWSGRLCDQRVHCSPSDTGRGLHTAGRHPSPRAVTLDASTRGPRARLDGIRHGNH